MDHLNGSPGRDWLLLIRCDELSLFTNFPLFFGPIRAAISVAIRNSLPFVYYLTRLGRSHFVHVITDNRNHMITISSEGQLVVSVVSINS